MYLVHEINTGDAFCDRMLDLKPRVHLQEVKVLLRVQQKLDRAGRVIPNGFGQCDGLIAHGSSRKIKMWLG